MAPYICATQALRRLRYRVMKYKPKGWGKTHTQKEPSYVGDFGVVFETKEFRKRVAKSRKKAKLARKARKSQ